MGKDTVQLRRTRDGWQRRVPTLITQGNIGGISGLVAFAPEVPPFQSFISCYQCVQRRKRGLVEQKITRFHQNKQVFGAGCEVQNLFLIRDFPPPNSHTI